ncbi:tripartite tricarboxylate transporter substrate binding protein [Cupriavidus sp. JZ107]
MQGPCRFSIAAICLASAFLTSTAATATTAAAGYPAKPIRVVVPFPAGGGTDIIAREVTNRVALSTGWTFVVENKPGSGGNLGIDAVAKAPADGYTIALGQTSNLAINATLYPRLPYKPMTDLAPIALVASAPLVLATSTTSPYKTLGEVISASRARPSAINFASPGNGTVAHLAGELFQKTAGIELTHIPYKGAAQAVNDLIGGQVDLYMASVPSLLGHIRNGKLRALAVTSTGRVADLPQVPTFAESNVKGFEASTWFGFVAPASTPKDIVVRLNAQFNKALQAAELKKKLNDQGATVLSGTPDQFGALIRQDIARWAAVVKASGTTLD